MKQNKTFRILPMVFGLFLIFSIFGLFWYGKADKAQAQDAAASPVAQSNTISSAFTYQGYLQQGGTPVDGVTCDFYFALWTAITGGTQYGTQTINGVNVNEGVFTVQIDVGNVFTGDGVWMETAVQCPSDPNFTTLTPRQPITATPYALSLQPGAVVDGNSEPVALSVIANETTNQIALYATTNKNGSVAVYGSSDLGSGVKGVNYAASVPGVYGQNHAVSGIGIKGQADQSGGVGVYGSSVNNTAVYGLSTHGKAVWGQSTNNVGVYGTSTANNVAGVYGGNGATTGIGVWGQADQSGGVGVYGSSVNNTAVYGTSTNGRAVWGESIGRFGVYGESYASTFSGVYGVNNSIQGVGVEGAANSANGVGVYGHSTVSTGVYGKTDNGVGVWGSNNGANTGSWAGYFDGRVTVGGNLSKAGGSFTIDHPLDPENMILQHSFVESPDMLNVYNGNITLDEMGEAWVSLPDYFEALNQDFRYQLTAVGAPGPNLYVAATVKDNQFKIAGGTPGMTVSWQITGIRHDPWAETNRIAVEIQKDEADQGLYLHPEAYGHPRADGIAAQFEAGRMTEDE